MSNLKKGGQTMQQQTIVTTRAYNLLQFAQLKSSLLRQLRLFSDNNVRKQPLKTCLDGLVLCLYNSSPNSSFNNFIC